MKLPSVTILGVQITTAGRNDIFAEASSFLSKKSGEIVIFTPNPEQIMLAHDDHEFRRVLNGADIAIPDGQGLLWAARGAVKERIPGVEFLQQLTAYAAKARIPVAFVGGRGGAADRAFDTMKRAHASLEGFAEDGPELASYGECSYAGEASELADRMADARIGVVALGFGAPKQERFAMELKETLSRIGYPRAVVIMVVGGSFDIISGKTKRAPVFFRERGLEWLWRLWLEPWRIGRQLNLIRFILAVALSSRN